MVRHFGRAGDYGYEVGLSFDGEVNPKRSFVKATLFPPGYWQSYALNA